MNLEERIKDSGTSGPPNLPSHLIVLAFSHAVQLHLYDRKEIKDQTGKEMYLRSHGCLE